MIGSVVAIQPSTPPVGVSPQVVNPNVVAQFESAMAETDGVPLVNALQATWIEQAEANHAMRTRIIALAESDAKQPMSLGKLSALQYEVMSLTYQQEVVTQISKKATDAFATLIKNG